MNTRLDKAVINNVIISLLMLLCNLKVIPKLDLDLACAGAQLHQGRGLVLQANVWISLSLWKTGLWSLLLEVITQ